uniref:Ubiquitin hydrolase n=1 Tax=Tanacetum cinerariifolium TaxID=118510 RepID=A0A6L2N7X6_TANCI|nr:ubiquitin hydrolase [Tanacetum cinerariifolium]
MMKKSSSSKNEPCCSKDCKKNTETLKKKITDLSNKLFDANNMIYHYKLALAQVESRLVEYKEREVKYIEKIRTLKFHNESHNKCIEILKKKLETLKLEKDGVDGKLAGLLKASKDLDNLIESQRPSPTVESTSRDDQNKNSSASENGESTDSILSKHAVKFVKAAERSTTNKVKTVKKPSVRYAKLYRKPTKKPNVRGNQRNWNNLKSQQLGNNFVMKKKACYNCDDFNHLAYDCRKRVKKGTSRSQNKTHESFTPKHVVHRPFRPPVRPIRSNMNSAQPNRTTFNKQAHSYANRPFQRISAVRSQYRASWVPTVNRNFPPVNRKFSTGSRNFPIVNEKFPTVSRKFPTGSTNVSTVCCCCLRHVNTSRTKAVINRRNWVNDVKASACWVWKPVKSNSASIILKRCDYVDVRGKSRFVMAWVPKKV